MFNEHLEGFNGENEGGITSAVRGDIPALDKMGNVGTITLVDRGWTFRCS